MSTIGRLFAPGVSAVKEVFIRSPGVNRDISGFNNWLQLIKRAIDIWHIVFRNHNGDECASTFCNAPDVITE
jgi:hypothetical protein